MIKECLIAGTGIIFNGKQLHTLGIKYDPSKHTVDLEDIPIDFQTIPNDADETHRPAFFRVHKMLNTHWSGLELALKFKDDSRDAGAQLYNQLTIAPFWWILELLPLLGTYQTEDGTWVRKRQYVLQYDFRVTSG
jgi:hypothetical protein